MADFALAVNFEGDYGFKVCFVDDGDTVAEAIKKIREQIAGVFVKPLPAETLFELRVQGEKLPIAPDLIVKNSGLIFMESVEVYSAG